jgi:hypothetical protein
MKYYKEFLEDNPKYRGEVDREWEMEKYYEWLESQLEEVEHTAVQNIEELFDKYSETLGDSMHPTGNPIDDLEKILGNTVLRKSEFEKMMMENQCQI